MVFFIDSAKNTFKIFLQDSALFIVAQKKYIVLDHGKMENKQLLIFVCQRMVKI